MARLRAVHGRVADLPDTGELCVLDDLRPDAFALPGGPGRADRIVVTTGMLRALEPVEREALLAHERAHLAARHHLFLSAAHLAGWCHPALASVTCQVSFAAERAADEAAARRLGDRAVTARAVGRAALAVSRARGSATAPASAPGAASGPVSARVRALLGQSRYGAWFPRCWLWRCCALRPGRRRSPGRCGCTGASRSLRASTPPNDLWHSRAA
ncbi:Protease HtpX [Streptomyces alboniger]